MEIMKEQSSIIHKSRKLLSDYFQHLIACKASGVASCLVCRDFLATLDHVLSNNSDAHEAEDLSEKKIQQRLRELFHTDNLCISMYHDNPQLTKSVAAQVGMELLLETSVTKTKVKMLFGKVVFSGTYDPSIVGVRTEQVRGGDVIVAEVIELIEADLSCFPHRFADEIKQLQLRGSSGAGINRISGSAVKKQAIEDFFSTCGSRVDVILDPIQHSSGTSTIFYPYYEGARKMAPQFRSRGIGYVRLGDDMSNFGSAFLSLDFGRSFLDGGANDANILNTPTSNQQQQVSQNLSKTAGPILLAFTTPTLTASDKSAGNSMNALKGQTEFSRSMSNINQRNRNHQSQSSLSSAPAAGSDHGGDSTRAVTADSSLQASGGQPPPSLALSQNSSTHTLSSYPSFNTLSLQTSFAQLETVAVNGSYQSNGGGYSPAPSPMGNSSVGSSRKQKLTESLRRIVTAHRSTQDLALDIGAATQVDIDDAMLNTPTPNPGLNLAQGGIGGGSSMKQNNVRRQLLPNSPPTAATTAEIAAKARTVEDRLRTALDQLASETQWKNRLDILTGLQEVFQTAGEEDNTLFAVMDEVLRSMASGSSGSGLLQRFLDALQEIFTKTQNPQVTVAALELLSSPFFLTLCGVVPSAPGNGSSVVLSAPIGTAWRGLLVEALHAVRHANRLIESAATRALGSLFAFSSSQQQQSPQVVRGMAWSQMTEALEALLGLPIISVANGGLGGAGASASSLAAAAASASPSTAAAATSSSSSAAKGSAKLFKLLDWLVQQLLSAVDSGSHLSVERPPMADVEVLIRLVKVCQVATKDREEKTRVASISLAAAIYLVYETIAPVQDSSGTRCAKELEKVGITSQKLAPALAKHRQQLSLLESSGKNNGTTNSKKANEATSTSSRTSALPAKEQRAAASSSTAKAAAVATVSAPPSPNRDGALGSRMLQLRLQEALLLLKRAPQSEAEWGGVHEIVLGADAVCTTLENISRTHKVPLGLLLRVLLPFTEQTSTLDQAHEHNQWRTQLHDDLRQLSQQHPTLQQAAAAIPMANWEAHSSALRRLRSVIRVKIADESDFRQAKAAVHTLRDFLRDYFDAVAAEGDADGEGG